MSREMEDIERALHAGISAAEGMHARSAHWSGREAADGYLSSLKEGLRACEKLRRDLREGRKHVDAPEAAYERGPTAVNLEKADEGHRLCEMCQGVGVTMIATCEGGYHAEKDVECPECCGEGQVEASA